MNTTYRKNLKDIATACKAYTDKVANDLRWELGTYDLSVESDTDVAHIKTLPSGAIQTTVAKVEGVGYKVNQLVKEISSTNWSANSSTATYTDGVATFTATAQNGNINQYLTSYLDNHKYLAIAQVKLTTANTNIRLYGNGGYLSVYSTATTDWQVLSKIFTGYSSEDRTFNIRDTRSSDWDAVQVKNAMLFDLTADFGSDNEPSTVSDCATEYAKRNVDIYSYTPQQSSIKNNAFTGVTIKDSNDNITETISVDLTTIKDSNNVSLFPSGKLMGNSSVADFITPYNQESRWGEYTFTGNESVSARTVAEGYNGFYVSISLDYKVHTTNFISTLELTSRSNVYSISGIELDTDRIYLTFPTSQGIDTTAKCIAFLTGKTMQYERATYLTSTTDLTTLTRINAQSNGTITLNNTGNVDMPNTIKSLKEVAKA